MSSGYDPPSVPGPRHSTDDAPVRPVETDGLYRPGGAPPSSPPLGGPPPPSGPPYSGPPSGPPFSGPPFAGTPGPPSTSAPPGYPPMAYPAPPYPLSAPPMSALPAPGGMAPGGMPPGPAAAGPPRRRAGWLGPVALGLAVLLAIVAGYQAFQIRDLQDRLGSADERVTQAQAQDTARFEDLEGRTGDLETKTFNPEDISNKVLPSVFRVAAGEFTGTAFAVGKPASGGGTHLFTNFHVVEAVWEAGDREVSIERRDQRWPATIVKVDEANDVAQLRTNSKFDGLPTATVAVKSGQQIVVVGAPLGLEDTVTSGVISAVRKDEGGSGTVIQFDASINPGNSGGPVVNAAKQVVGIATAKARDAEGIGLAVPIKTACDEFKIC
ncbi:trypsin-like peptidase domain-containing protein [Actinomycetes bacterium KLBMP 9797]